MAQTPTNATPKGVVEKFKGLNDRQDSVARAPGTVTTALNVVDETAQDANRRAGRNMVSLDNGEAVGIIVNLAWDDGGVSIVTVEGHGSSPNLLGPFQGGTGGDWTTGTGGAGEEPPRNNPLPTPVNPTAPSPPAAASGTGTAAYGPITFSSDNPPGGGGTGGGTGGAGGGDGSTNGVLDPSTPGPLPTTPSFLPMFLGSKGSLPDFTSFMRSLSELSKFLNAGTDALVWPNRTWSVDIWAPTGNKILEDVTDKKTILAYKALWGYSFSVRPITIGAPAASDGTLIPDDFYWTDYFVQPSLANTHLDGTYIGIWRSIRQHYNSIKNSFIKTYPIEGATTLANFTAADDVAATLSFDPSMQEIANCSNILAAKINDLKYVEATATTAQLFIKAGDANAYCPSAEQQIDLLKTAYNERRALLGLSQDTTAIADYPTPTQWVDYLTRWSPSSFYASPWINTAVHPDGEIEGAASVTYWSGAGYTAAIADVTWFTMAFSTHDGHPWTNDVATTDGMGPVQVDSLDGLFCQLLTRTISKLLVAMQNIEAITVAATQGDFDLRQVTNGGWGTTRTCADALACAQKYYPSLDYPNYYTTNNDGADCSVFSSTTGHNSPISVVETGEWNGWAPGSGNESYGVDLGNTRGKIACDLTSYTATTALSASFYLQASGYSGGVSNNPPVTADSTWRKAGVCTLATNWKSGYIGDQVCTLTVSCTSPGTQKGWKVDDECVVVIGKFTV